MRYGYQFGFFNAINFQIATGTPLILFAKSLGASATVLGILASLLPLFTFLQIPAAGYLPRFGYRKFMLLGWGLRTIMVFALAGIPLLLFVDAPTKVALILFLLVIFSVLRGISAGVWWPWITELLPKEQRGNYLSGEQLSVHGGSLAALGVSALTLQFLPDPYRYSAIFFLSAFAGVISLYSLKNMPDVLLAGSLKQSSHPVPWRAIIGFLPFRKLLLFGGLWSVATSSLITFTVAFTRESLHYNESNIVYLSLFVFLGALTTLPFTARFINKIGVKGALYLTTFFTGCVALGWLTLAAGVWHGNWWTVALLNFGFGMATANFAVANASVVMGIFPVMGRNHFFALYTVTTSLITALAPIFFGILIDALRRVSSQWGAWAINPYSIYFFISIALLVITCLTVSILKTHEIGDLNHRDFTILANLRRFGRLLHR